VSARIVSRAAARAKTQIDVSLAARRSPSPTIHATRHTRHDGASTRADARAARRPERIQENVNEGWAGERSALPRASQQRRAPFTTPRTDAVPD